MTAPGTPALGACTLASPAPGNPWPVLPPPLPFCVCSADPSREASPAPAPNDRPGPAIQHFPPPCPAHSPLLPCVTIWNTLCLVICLCQPVHESGTSWGLDMFAAGSPGPTTAPTLGTQCLTDRRMSEPMGGGGLPLHGRLACM